MNRQQSEQIFQTAQSHFIGGVNSPVRAFGSVGGTPIVAQRGQDATIIDVDDNAYIDFVLSWGPLILGHAHSEVIDAVQKVIADGTSFGMPTEAENRLAQAIRQFFPECEKLRFVNSGTEATMSALRLARGYTKRDKIIKFVGCYHGHSDGLLVDAGSGLATLGIPGSPGVTKGAAADTITVDFNDSQGIREAFSQYEDQIAAVILEVLPCNAGMIFPDPDFLQTLQELCRAHATLIIADEVLTGLRAAKGGAYHRFGVEPDLVCLGKVIGGGLPLAAYGGRQEIMAELAPQGGVYQAGTLSGNPVAATAGAVTLEILQRDDPFTTLETNTAWLADHLKLAAQEVGQTVVCSHAGSLFALVFANHVPRNFTDMTQADHQAYGKFFWGMLERGVYLAPSGYEVGFMSTAHNQGLLEETVAMAKQAFADLN